MKEDSFHVLDGQVTAYIGNTVPGDWLDASSLADGDYTLDEHGNVFEYHQEPAPSDIAEKQLWDESQAVKTLVDADVYLRHYRDCTSTFGWNNNPHVLIYCDHDGLPTFGEPSLLFWAYTVDSGAPYVNEGVRLSPVSSEMSNSLYVPTHLGPIGQEAAYTSVGVVPKATSGDGRVNAFGRRSEWFEHYIKCPSCTYDVRVTRGNLEAFINGAVDHGVYGVKLSELQYWLSKMPRHNGASK